MNAQSHELSVMEAGDRIDREALEWLVRTQGSPDAATLRQLRAWCDADPRHAAALVRWQQEWSALDALPAAALRQLRAGLAKDQASAEPRARPRGLGWGRGAATLASVCLVAAAGGLGYRHWQQQPVYEQALATGLGQQSEVQLPDGSTLRLDTNTRLDVTFRRQRREVVLPEGQAVFRVQGDAARPFDVLAGPMRITVVGTRFSVRYTPGVPGDAGVRVAVEEGRVRVARAGDDGPDVIELTAGQQVVSDAAGRLGPVAAVPNAGIAPWRDGRVSFDDTPLSQALAEFARYGSTQLVVRDTGVAALRLTGTFDPRRLDNFTRSLPSVLPVQLRERGAVTEIVAAPHPPAHPQ
ncbi:FecR domain-containing protein [Acidovorax sp. sic0104]|uniref:FecR family protein n=1 Tax=Acidovorax sp. sic0104 TaxID=2854784 RepID=UPI002107D207|nr:FecR domain-containing protein [Acidovorax sp. sic0104]